MSTSAWIALGVVMLPILGWALTLVGVLLDRIGNGPGAFERQREFERQFEKRKRQVALPQGFADEVSYLGKMGKVALDSRQDILAIWLPDTNVWEEIPLSHIISAEMTAQEGGVTHTTSSRSLTGAVVGGLTFGAAGAIVGGLGGRTKSTTRTQLESIKLHIQVRDIARPIRSVEFGQQTWDGSWVSENHQLDQAKEWLFRISQIVENRFHKTNPQSSVA